MSISSMSNKKCLHSVTTHKLVATANLSISGRGDSKSSPLFRRDLLEDLFYYFLLIAFKQKNISSPNKVCHPPLKWTPKKEKC